MFTVMRPPVYPRWRGELTMAPAKNALVGGLSPLARGTLGGLPCSQLQQRFIPAGAGNSSWLAISFGVSPVYPRWRGELSVFGITFGFGCGLSPLARGTL